MSDIMGGESENSKSEENTDPGLYGINYSDKDFSQEGNWGKNKFNNAFPVSLTLYMHSKGIDPVYITLNNKLETEHGNISAPRLFGADKPSELFFDIESVFTPYQKFSKDLPGIDLVTKTRIDGEHEEYYTDTKRNLRPIEIKLTALPDNSTYDLEEEEYSCEIVVRPDTIVYLICGILSEFEDQKDSLISHFEGVMDIENWSDWDEVKNREKEIADTFDDLFKENLEKQKPLVMQPVWKTEGKSLKLEDQCFDVFVWSDFAFTRLFWDQINFSSESSTRGDRTLIWLAKMMINFIEEDDVYYDATRDSITFGSQTDKAFARSGSQTHQFLESDNLIEPRVPRTALLDIIQGGGHKLLSPERRLDAAVSTTIDLFDED